MSQHFTYDGPRTAKGGAPSDERFDVWARFATHSTGQNGLTGPEANRWMLKQRAKGATNVGAHPNAA
jgi:hypothetical protein